MYLKLIQTLLFYYLPILGMNRNLMGTVLKNQCNLQIQVHHGSLSRDAREETEKFLRTGIAGIVVMHVFP